MISIKNIISISKYERKILMRSWFFRIFGLFSIVLLVLLNIIMFTAPTTSSWTNRAVAANIPYFNVLLINIAQAIILIFLASDFLRRDKKLDTTETIYSRAITNGEYVIGKTLGVLSIFLGMVILVLLIALVFNFIKQDTPIVWQAYLFYPILITIPTIIFILGLSFIAMILIKNQAVTFILLLGYIGLSLFFLNDKLFGVWDYMSFYLPMVYSDFIGFADFEKIILHRLTYFFLGIAFIFATIRWLNRLAQTGRWNNLNVFLFLLFLFLGTLSGFGFFQLNNKAFSNREFYQSINQRLASDLTPDVISNNLEVHHEGNLLKINSDLLLANPSSEPMDTINLSLNPGFTNLQITLKDQPADFVREGHIIRIIPGHPLLKGDSLAIRMGYSGTPIEDVCYLDIPDKTILQRKKTLFLNIGKHYGIVSSNYVLLTPEILWYPIAGVTYNRKTLLPNALDFSKFTLKVEARQGMTVFSQGEKTISEDGISAFTPEMDLNGLSLVIGAYEQRTIKIDSLDLSLAILPGHDFFSKNFTHIIDTLPDLIKQYKYEYEVENVKLSYPFKRATLIEVPLQYHAYQRNTTQVVQNVQPEMFFIPEKGSGISTMDFARFQYMETRRNRNEELVRTPEEIERDVFRRFITQTFFIENSRSSGRMGGSIIPSGVFNLSGISFSRNPYSAFPQYYSFKTGFVSSEIPIFNTMMESYLNGGFNTSPFMGSVEGMTDIEKANLTLRDYSLYEVMNSWRNDLASTIISQKGYFLMTSLKNRVGIQEFDDFIYNYIETHNFSVINLDQFRQDFSDKFNVDINPYLASINTLGEIPVFLFSDISYIQTRDDYGQVYMVRFSATNTGKVKGLIDVTFESGRGFRSGSASEAEERIYELDSAQTKEFQVVLYEQPRIMTINTIISENIPSTIRQFLRQSENSREIPYEYEEVLDHQVTKGYENEIVVDNEDPGFSFQIKNTQSKLKSFIESKEKVDEGISYSGAFFNRIPKKWTAITNSSLYGNVRLSAMITSGNPVADQFVRWKTPLPSASLYNVYVYIPLNILVDRSSMRGGLNSGGRSGGGRSGGGRSGGSPSGEGGQGEGSAGGRQAGAPKIADEGSSYNYTIISKNGKEHVEFVLENVTDGWNKIGSFDLPADTVTVELSNKTSGKRVVADAVKFVKANDLIQ